MAEKKQKNYKEMTDKELFKLMAGPSQLKRKNASKVLSSRVKEKPEAYKSNIEDFIDALSRPEAQTRWEALDSLTFLVPVDAKSCKPALEGAEEALFDEKTSLIRESAVRFLSRYGASSVTRSKEVWPLLKEALQQLHGEIEFDKILNRLIFFASGKLDPTVKREFRKEVKEIANSVGGPTKTRLDRILLALSGKSIDKVVEKTSSPKKAAPKATASKKAAASKSANSSTKKPSATKASAKKTSAAKKAVSTKKSTNSKKSTSTKKSSSPKKTTTAKKSTAEKKPAASKKSTSTKKTTVAKKSTSAKKPTTAKKSTVSKKPAASKKTAAAKKPAAKSTSTKKTSAAKKAIPAKKASTKKPSLASKFIKKVTKRKSK